ncbi:ABC transporter ATP-binding protein/permease [Faecalibacillus intestinalis]|uniref:ABC transporter ATP-binding protein/permease n=1 Tax=Faecalibacillus intestinalis TaxID=1982626 RepID=UPI0035229F86
MGLELKNVTKKFKTIEGERVIFENLNIHFPDYGLIAITGESGCGKSTLLQLIAGLDQDYEGKILFNQVKIEDIKDYRQLVISFVYQNYQLFDYLSVKDNCLFYCHLKGIKVVEKQLQELLEIFELNELVNQKVKNLSGGQKQRVALIRALLCSSPIILCDEPTGALDEINRQKVYRFLKKASQRRLILIVSHDQIISKYTPYHLNFECLKHHYDWNHQLYSRYEIRKTKCGLLFKETIQMILKDKKKWVMMFVSQIYMVLAMTLIITGLEGFNGYYQKQYNQAMNNNLVMIQKKNQEPFKEKEITKLKGKYQYHLDIGKIEGLKNFQSFSINKKTKQNEVYVNHALITKIKQNKLIYKINHHQYTLKIKGVIQDDYQEPVLYYHSLSNEIALQCIDVSTCIVYVKNHKYMKDYLTHLSVQYQGIAPIYEEYESYFKVIDLFKKVSLVFIFLSFMIAIVLMGYMVLSMFYENQKIYAIMLANGYQNNHLAFFILKKISLMMISIGIVSCLVSSGVLKIISFFDISKKIWGINHLFVLPREFQWPFTLYFFYLLGYIVQGILLSLFIVLKMKKIKMYECLREE